MAGRCGRFGTGSLGAVPDECRAGGFATEGDAREALEKSLEKQRRRNGAGKTLTLAELADQYLARHDAAPVTREKLRWLLAKPVAS